MRIEFDDAKLKKQMEKSALLDRKYGSEQARRIRNRIAQLRAVESIAELQPLPGRWHELTANWHEHWSGDLVHPWRLIIRPVDPVHRKEDGGVSWQDVSAVAIVGIYDTHGG